MNETRKIDRILSAVLIALFSLFIISLSIYLPLNNREFYYSQIDTLKEGDVPIIDFLNYYTGENYTKEDVKEAFDDVMDFIWKGEEFKTGKLKFSESGKNHFADCIPLFWLDFIVLIVSSISIIVLMILLLLKKWVIVDFKGFSPLFYGGIISIGIIGGLLLLALILALILTGGFNFDILFTYFHKLFFPGKENWMFDPSQDEVILILPQDFFMNCGIFIGCGLVVFSSSAIVYGIFKRKRIQKMVGVK